MNKPEDFELLDGYASYRPVRHVTFQQALELVTLAVVYAREQGIERLYIDSTGLTGFEPPSTLERFSMGGQLARAAQSAVKVAMVARAELIDPKRFGLVVARNRGLLGEVFTDQAEALRWLQAVGAD